MIKYDFGKSLMNGSMYLASRFLRLGAGNVAQRQGTCSV